MPTKNLKIGIVYEGNKDLEVVRILISRILDKSGIEFSIIKDIKIGTGIIGFTKLYTRTLFQNGEVDIVIFLTDQDVPPKIDNRRGKIEEEIAKVNPGYLDFVVIGVPDPHLEKWLVADEDILKGIFRLKGDKEVPYSKMSPKSQIRALKEELPLPQPSLFEVYISLANKLRLEVVQGICKDFARFQEDLIRVSKKVRNL